MFLSSGVEKTQNGDKLGRPSIDDLIQSLSLQIGQQKTKDLSGCLRKHVQAQALKLDLARPKKSKLFKPLMVH